MIGKSAGILPEHDKHPEASLLANILWAAAIPVGYLLVAYLL